MCLNFKGSLGPGIRAAPSQDGTSSPSLVPVSVSINLLMEAGRLPHRRGAPRRDTQPLSQGGPRLCQHSPSPTRGHSFGLNIRLKTRLECSRF